MRAGIYLILILVCCSSNLLFAQEKCGTSAILEQMQTTNPEIYAKIKERSKTQVNAKITDDIYVIPVVVHIVYNTEAENIDDTRVYTQINVLNEDFRRLNADTIKTLPGFESVAADVGIEFCLAFYDPYGDSTTGIIRTYTDTTEWLLSFSEEVKETSQMGDDAWPASSYLNIWVCDLQDGILGYAVSPGASPEVDGVVIDYKNFGIADVSSKPYDLGRTCTHEVGHWLGLTHVWGDDGGTCAGSDGINDTPDQAEATYGCPNTVLVDACSPTAPGIIYQNYMDYTDDACMNLFTEDQKTRMRSVMETYRASLLTSAAGCNEIGPLPGDIAEILVYPVPTSGQFTVSIKNFLGYQDNFNIAVYNSLGQIIASANPSAANNVAQYFDLSYLASGCYIVQVFNGTYFLTQQFMVY